MIFDLITNTIGLSFIDDNMGNIVTALGLAGPKFGLLDLAKSLAVCLALGVGSYEAYMMMLGRRGMDVMKILRIIIISLCIANSGAIASALRAPGKAMEAQAKAQMDDFNAMLENKEKEVKKSQDDFMDEMFARLDSINDARVAAAIAENSDSFTPDAVIELSMLPEKFEGWAKKGAIWLEMMIANLINTVVRWISELIFQLMYYGIIITQLVCLNLMGQFLPLAFALSLAPAYKSAWSQFISKYLAVTLWAPICYCMVCYIDIILSYQLACDQKAIAKITELSWAAIGGLGLDMLGTTVTYAAGLLIGAKMISMSTEIAGWLIPGGMSSGMGGAVSGGVMGAVTGAAAGAVTGAASTAGGAAIGAYGGTTESSVRGAASGTRGALQNYRGIGSDTKK